MVILDYDDDSMRCWESFRQLYPAFPMVANARKSSDNSHVRDYTLLKVDLIAHTPTTFNAAGDALQLLLSVSTYYIVHILRSK